MPRKVSVKEEGCSTAHLEKYSAKFSETSPRSREGIKGLFVCAYHSQYLQILDRDDERGRGAKTQNFPDNNFFRAKNMIIVIIEIILILVILVIIVIIVMMMTMIVSRACTNDQHCPWQPELAARRHNDTILLPYIT